MVTVCPSQFATRRTLFHVLVGCGLLMLKVSRLKLPVIWLLDRKSGSAGMPRPISYAVFCLKKKKSEGVFEGRDRATNELKWTGTRVDLVFGSNSQLRALAKG